MSRSHGCAASFVGSASVTDCLLTATPSSPLYTSSCRTLCSMTPIPVCDRHPPIFPERPVRDLHPRRRLATFVLTTVHERHDLLDCVAIEAGGDQVSEALVLFHVSPNDGIEDFVRRKGILVRLVGTQLGRWRSGEHALGNDGISLPRVSPPGQFIDKRLRHVLDDREPASHIAVQRRVADAHLALIPGRQDQPPVLV